MKKILLVDEVKPFLDYEQSIVRRSDIKIFTASSGDEALRVHEAEKVNLIIASLDMQGMPGDKLCMRIREDEGLKKVSLILVCSGRKTDRERCANCGANTYIMRPIDPVELRESVDKLLEVPHRRSLRVLIKVSVKGQFKSEPFFCTSENISSSGLLLEAERALAKGDRISCSFYIPDEDRVLADCEVVRVDKKKEYTFHYGLKFLDLEKHYIEAIDRFVKKNLRA